MGQKQCRECCGNKENSEDIGPFKREVEMMDEVSISFLEASTTLSVIPVSTVNELTSWADDDNKPKIANFEAFRLLDVNLHIDPSRISNVGKYYALCGGIPGLHVTTSCFTAWRKNDKTNGHAKVIPALPVDTVFKPPFPCVADARPFRIFFFDDNLEWDGAENSSGICNLRHVESGDYVNFAEGQNGFTRETAAEHTVIHVSNEYHNILVKANILDAMADLNYFSDIIKRYSNPGERVMIFMDVNATIICSDAVQGKDVSATLLGTMFEFVELAPDKEFELEWEGYLKIQITTKVKTLKTIVKDMTKQSKPLYENFFTEERSWSLFEELLKRGQIRWTSNKFENLTIERFKEDYQRYLKVIEKEVTEEGICRSWFEVAAKWGNSDDHSIHLNSFGVDTRKVILATIQSEKRVMHVTVNHELWDDRDAKKFAEQFN